MTKYTPIIIITILIGATVILPDTTVFAETQAGDYWVSKSPIPTENPALVIATTVNGKIYAIGDQTQTYDPKLDTWTTKAAMPTSRTANFGTAVVENKIYCIGGGSSGLNEVYDTHTNTWTTKASIPTPRKIVDTHVIDNKIYVIGGEIDALTISTANEAYNPATDVWGTKASLPTPRMTLCTHVVDGKIYVIGGRDAYIPGTYRYSKVFDTNEVYDPKTDTWTTLTSMPVADEGYLSAVIDNKIYVFCKNVTCIYDTATDSWSLGAAIPTYQFGRAVATSGVCAPKKIYVIGGYINSGSSSNPNSRVTNITQVYDPILDDWSLGAEMLTARTAFSVVAVDDAFYALGGAGIFGNILSSYKNVNEVYYPGGYGTSDPTYIPPTPTPTSTPNTQPDGIQVELILILCVLIIATVVVVFGYIFKRKQCGRVR